MAVQRRHPSSTSGTRSRSKYRPAAVDPGDRQQVDLNTGDHTEVSASTAQPPEQVLLVLRTHAPQPPVGGDQVDAAHVVGGETMTTGQQPHPAAQGVGHGAHPGEASRERRQAVRGGRLDHVAPAGSGLHPRGLRRRVHPDPAHTPGGDQHAALQRAGATVTGRLHRHPFAARGGELYGAAHVLLIYRLHDHRGPVPVE